MRTTPTAAVAVRRGHGLLILLVAACGAPADRSPAHANASWTPELAEEVRQMGVADQAVRDGLGPATIQDTAFLGRMARSDSSRSRRLRGLVEERDWPRSADVGEEAAEAAFLVVQHSPFQDWQEAMLPHIEKAVRAGDLDPQDYALLFDRVRVQRGRPQRFGTQLSQGSDSLLHVDQLEDTAAVDSLRADLGLPPLDAYLTALESATGMKVAR